ncbi:calexcitin-2 [Daphnia magna]|uniref:Calcium-binding protein n=2 Tax=Daphnia magna TaxID=35525 RepID=A0A0P5TAC6_9CRUS|nr:calexcitin-2 [Daphnia magna]XP_032786209.1 calexcitin-2 [Daphnia magna]XP_045029648.1 calexcitin-2 [Daphnia magna]KAK4008663.1 hypothetical protein OUZ56_013796 [Daphnia magna]KZS21948.1 Calcium-binding protein [Daphnia magna]
MAMSDFRRNKLIYVFKAFFDVDNSGAIDQQDFCLAAERICRVHGWTVNEGKGAEVLQRLLDVWEALKRADSNSDGSVDQNEWCTMWETYAKGGNDSQEWQDKYRDFYFSIMDTSGEGTIELDEFAAVNKRDDVSDKDCSEAFKLLSKNNSSIVNSSTFAQLWKEFFTSDDPSAPGNFIYGKLKF